MRVLSRWATVVALGAVFAAGWGSSVLANPTRPARAESPRPAPEPGATCTDPNAMEANANLVEQVRDYQRRLAVAEERRSTAEAAVARATARDGERLATSSDEWRRMAREGTVRLRVPCSSWDGPGRFSLKRAMRGVRGVYTSSSSRRFEKGQRAESAGLSTEELETLASVYRRVHERTWASMRGICEASRAFREAMVDLEEPTDEVRVTMCRSALLDVNDPSGRAAITRVAELRAANAPAERATTDRERVMFTLTNAQQSLEEEMVRAFGREKTTRAIDNGVTCFDETLYDIHEPTDG